MRLLELRLNHFGKFHKKGIKLEDGINLIYGENEAGKSTLHAFIKGMLFGMERLRGRASREDAYMKYQPWDMPGAYDGSLDLEIKGKAYRILRNFDMNHKNLTVLDLETGRELPLHQEELGAFYGGLTEAGYRNTVSIEQQKARTDKELAEEVRNYITNISLSKSKEVDVSGALSFLQVKRKEIEACRTEKKLTALEEEIEEGLALEARLDRLTVQLGELDSQEEELLQKKKGKKKALGGLENFGALEEYQKWLEYFPVIREKYRGFKETKIQEEALEEKKELLETQMQDLERFRQENKNIGTFLKEAESIKSKLNELEIRKQVPPPEIYPAEELEERAFIETNLEKTYPGKSAFAEKGSALKKKGIKFWSIALTLILAGILMVLFSVDKIPLNKLFTGIFSAGGSSAGKGLLLPAGGVLLFLSGMAVLLYGVARESRIRKENEEIQRERKEIQREHEERQREYEEKRKKYEERQRKYEERQREYEGKLREYKKRLKGYEEESEALKKELQDIFRQCSAANEQELKSKQEKLLRWELSMEHMQKQTEEYKEQLALLKEKKQDLREEILEYTRRSSRSLPGMEGRNTALLEDSLMYILEDAVGKQREKLAGEEETLEKEIQDCRLQKEKLKWELEASRENEENLYRNRQWKKELLLLKKSEEEELAAIRLAEETIQTLSAEIHDGFGQKLNHMVSGLSKEITEGKYSLVRVDEKLNIKAGNQDTLVPVDRLSTGTGEQLYFSLRMGVADLMFGEGTMPVLLDDCFALYDDNRTKAVLETLSGKRKGQILLFTCHKREKEILDALQADYHYINLTEAGGKEV